MRSARLRYEPLAPAQLGAFHALVVDPHVRRYLMDGNVFPPQWSAERIADSEALFARRGVGLWLARDEVADDWVGFCGFMEIPTIHPDPQLVYALVAQSTGKGYATEMARAAIAHARAQGGFAEVFASVDAVNAASVRVLDKLGFARIATGEGAFGDLFVYRLGAARA
jgi:RimJ/RimL family protein N-acetyltransferase